MSDNANPYVPELDLFTKEEGESQEAHIRKAIVRRLSMEIGETYMKYVEAVNRYQEMMRLIEAFAEAKNE